MKNLLRLLAFCILTASLSAAPWDHGKLVVSKDGRALQHADGTPFFWLGDTAWLLTQKLTREEVKTYFENRRAKGFNVVQLCVVQFLSDKSIYGRPALVGEDITKLNVTPGSDPSNPAEYDYWDHVDFVLDTAAANNIYVAIAPVWSHMVRRTPLTAEQVGPYIAQVAQRYKDRANVIWLNGGSARGHENADVWQVIGETLKRHNPEQLVSFHPFGRTVTTEWFKDTAWLDLHMFTSGHRRYDQDNDGSRKYGEDNWRYVLESLAADPKRPVIDAEPAYENTPQGLHKPTEPYWTGNDSRRYAYWSVFAGAAGHTYGENSVRQVYIASETKPASGAKGFIMERLDAEGSTQMKHLKDFILSRPSAIRVNDQSLVAGDEGEKHNRILVTRGEGWIAAYNYTGRDFTMKLDGAAGSHLKASWLNPRTGEINPAGAHPGSGSFTFNPPGDPAPGNDWVLVLEDAGNPGDPPTKT